MNPDQHSTPPSENADLVPFFNPQGIVVVGASQNPAKLGFGLARNLIQSDFRGAVHFVTQTCTFGRTNWIRTNVFYA